jgi:hypothetical protein
MHPAADAGWPRKSALATGFRSALQGPQAALFISGDTVSAVIPRARSTVTAFAAQPLTRRAYTKKNAFL